MKTFRSLPLLLVVGLSGTLEVRAQDDEKSLKSGPAAGSALTPIKCYATNGPLRGKEFDAAEKLGTSASAVLFIHELTRNTAPVLRGLDELAAEYEVLGFQSFTVLLAGDRTEAEGRLQRVNGSLRLKNPIVLSTEGAEGPGNYALNRKAALTLVFAKDGKVTRSLALTDTGPNDVPVVRKAIVDLVGELPRDPEALKKLVRESLPSDPDALKEIVIAQRMELKRLQSRVERLRQQGRGRTMRPQQGDPPKRRPQGEEGETKRPPRQGGPPADGKLGTLLRSYIRKTNDEDRVNEVYDEIMTRGKENEELQEQVVEMFKLMLSYPDRYGTEHAQKKVRKYLDERKAP